MVNWESPDEIIHEFDALTKTIHVAMGVYVWEFLLSLDVELSIITRKRAFQWPLIFYFGNRYAMLFLIILIIFNMDYPPALTNAQCAEIVTASQILFYASIVLASINLAFRTAAIWRLNRYIMFVLGSLVIGEIVLICLIKLPKHFVPQEGCTPIDIPSTFAAALHIYPMCFDVIVFALAAWRVRIHEATSRSKLAVVLFRDGLFYIIVSLLVNIVVAVLEILNLNPLMDGISNIPAVMAMTIAATRAVRNLRNEGEVSLVQFTSHIGPSPASAVLSDVRFASGPNMTAIPQAVTRSVDEQHVAIPVGSHYSADIHRDSTPSLYDADSFKPGQSPRAL
ncbi:hypothetical protein K474DRAFT_1711863 [Panus rudis PR-1116 ss-1]|nr:hypothetical protein K474DRAFT_1711863 [Panus rudis PR-1116 ss-1]